MSLNLGPTPRRSKSDFPSVGRSSYFVRAGVGSGCAARDPDLRCRSALKSALTQFWCSLGTCGTFAGIDDKSVISRKPLLRSEQRDASSRVQDNHGWTIEADGQDSAVCPGCQSASRSRHSRYWRSLQDLPIQGTAVLIRLHVGHWRCRNAGCEQRIFTERPFKVSPITHDRPSEPTTWL